MTRQQAIEYIKLVCQDYTNGLPKSAAIGVAAQLNEAFLAIDPPEDKNQEHG